MFVMETVSAAVSLPPEKEGVGVGGGVIVLLTDVVMVTVMVCSVVGVTVVWDMLPTELENVRSCDGDLEVDRDGVAVAEDVPPPPLYDADALSARDAVGSDTVSVTVSECSPDGDQVLDVVLVSSIVSDPADHELISVL